MPAPAHSAAPAADGESTRIIALRHGRTAWNRATRIQGHTDIPLDALGRAQAERAAAALADAGLAAVYSSDLLRTQATAQPLARRLALPVVADVRLRERHFGAWEGMAHADIVAQYPLEAQRWHRREPGFQPGGGESLQQFFARCVPAVAELAAHHPGQAIAVVAHGGVLDCLYRAATGLALDAPRSWILGNASINRLLWHGEGFALVGWDDQSHLQGLDEAALDAEEV
jgi:probable phosphoglycerate mutase